MYEFFEDEKRYYIVTEYELLVFNNLAESAKVENSSTKLSLEVNSLRKMPLSWWDKSSLASITATRTTSFTGKKLSRFILNRDLKPENILLEQNKDFDQIKIIDFGTSLQFDSTKTLDEKLGTPYYIAPEVLKKCYNEKCDIWSCGVITYIILSGMPPFNGSSDQEIMKKVSIGKFSFSDPCWSNISDKAKDFITKLLTFDKDKRISAEDALKHPWITDMSAIQVDQSVAMGALSNLKTFRADQKLKQATFAFIASQLLTKSEKENFAKIFKAIDLNGDGKLSKDEILQGYN